MHDSELTGAPEEIRTPDPQIRSLVLYPAELRARIAHSRGKCSRAGQIRRERALAIGFGRHWQASQHSCPVRRDGHLAGSPARLTRGSIALRKSLCQLRKSLCQEDGLPGQARQ